MARSFDLDICRYGHIFGPIARAATTSDAFNAVAEPQRRRILVLLKGRERPVNELARALRITQPRTSKHLRVLREVGLVRVRESGHQRLYAPPPPAPAPGPPRPLALTPT